MKTNMQYISVYFTFVPSFPKVQNIVKKPVGTEKEFVLNCVRTGVCEIASSKTLLFIFSSVVCIWKISKLETKYFFRNLLIFLCNFDWFLETICVYSLLLLLTHLLRNNPRHASVTTICFLFFYINIFMFSYIAGVKIRKHGEYPEFRRNIISNQFLNGWNKRAYIHKIN